MAREWIKSILAGAAISLGCMASVSVGGGLPGAVIFSIGLITVCLFKLSLFTGKVCYASQDALLRLFMILAGNCLASVCMGLLWRFTKPDTIAYVQRLSTLKLGEGLRVIPLGILCNVMIFLGVDAWRMLRESSKTLGTLMITMCVVVFIICGFEHCIANTFYLACSGDLFTWAGGTYLAVNILANAIGGLLACKLIRLTEVY